MIGAFEVHILAADLGKARRKLRPHEPADERHCAADRPGEQDVNRVVKNARDVRRVGEDPDADDPAHDDDRRVEEAELAAEAGG